MKENDIPKLKISKGLINVNKLLSKLEELEEHVPVGFTEDGGIPDYIEFDRTVTDLYIMVEEVLTMYVNNKHEIEKEYEDMNVSDFGKEYQSDDELFQVFPMTMFKQGSVTRKDTVIDVRKMFGFIVNCNKEIQSLIEGYDIYHSTTMKLYICELVNNNNYNKKIKKLYIDAICELEKILVEVEEIALKAIFKYLDDSYQRLVNNVVVHEYVFDIGMKFTIMKNAVELHAFEFIKEKREQINQMLSLEYYKVNKLMQIKNDGDDI